MINFPADLLQLLKKAERIAVLTGAGVSQESGLRTFRDEQEGFWTQYKPEDLATPEAFERNPKLVWDWYAFRRETARAANPNPGHFALAQIENHVPEFTLITQNVDGLHRAAGSVNVLELHGNITRVLCSKCGEYAQTWGDDSTSVPVCALCGGLLRPDVVWFGESLPQAELQKAVNATRACQIFFSIGTSGVVQPAASLARAAHANGATLIEVNADPTPLTPSVDFAFHGKSGEILPALVNAVWGAD
jgi:NAD-dependent deacetylase